MTVILPEQTRDLRIAKGPRYIAQPVERDETHATGLEVNDA